MRKSFLLSQTAVWLVIAGVVMFDAITDIIYGTPTVQSFTTIFLTLVVAFSAIIQSCVAYNLRAARDQKIALVDSRGGMMSIISIYGVFAFMSLALAFVASSHNEKSQAGLMVFCLVCTVIMMLIFSRRMRRLSERNRDR